MGKPFALNSPQRKIICDSTHPRSFHQEPCGHCLALPLVCHLAHMSLSSHLSCGDWELPSFSIHSVYVTCLKDGDPTCMDVSLPTQWLHPYPVHTVDNLPPTHCRQTRKAKFPRKFGVHQAQPPHHAVGVFRCVWGRGASWHFLSLFCDLGRVSV